MKVVSRDPEPGRMDPHRRCQDSESLISVTSEMNSSDVSVHLTLLRYSLLEVPLKFSDTAKRVKFSDYYFFKQCAILLAIKLCTRMHNLMKGCSVYVMKLNPHLNGKILCNLSSWTSIPQC